MIKQIQKCNQRLAEALGYCGSEPRFQWRHSTELFYFMRDGAKTLEPQSGNRLAVVIPTYKRYCWADRIGKMWALAQWRIPQISQQQWEHQTFGSEFPYPKNGQYYYIDNTGLRDGMPPDEDCTELAIMGIRAQLEMDVSKFIYDTEREMTQQTERVASEMEDELVEMMPAFAGPAIQGIQ